MTSAEQRAWAHLTADMAGGAHQYDNWEDVPAYLQQRYLDRDLLERAARAAGIILGWSSDPDLSPRCIGTFETWNPLTDDGDALRLAVQLDISISYTANILDSSPGMVICKAQFYPGLGEYAEVMLVPQAATRRAIVRTAAALEREAA